MENGTIVLIGATTENPYFEVNKSLISRSSVFMLKPLNKERYRDHYKNALSDKERGLGEYDIVCDDEAITYLAEVSTEMQG